MSSERGKDSTVKYFREGKTDELKAVKAFTNSKHHLYSIDNEVRAWVESNWRRWEEEKPKWLDENMKANIPVEWIPGREAQEKEKRRRQKMKEGLKRVASGIKKSTSGISKTVSSGISEVLTSIDKGNKTIQQLMEDEGSEE